MAPPFLTAAPPRAATPHSPKTSRTAFIPLPGGACDGKGAGPELYSVSMAMAYGFHFRAAIPSRPELVEGRRARLCRIVSLRRQRHNYPLWALLPDKARSWENSSNCQVAALQENFFDGKRDKKRSTQRRGTLGLPTQRLEPPAAPTCIRRMAGPFPTSLSRSWKNEPITIYGSWLQTRSFRYRSG